MMLRKHLRVAPLLILVLSFFRGHTLTCRRSEYLNGDQCCPMCSAGSRVRKHCTEFKSTSCLDCFEGTFMNRPTGLTECFPCTHCDSGAGVKIKTPCTAIFDTVCEPLEGFYCTDPSKNGCVAAEKHSSCQPGQYIRQKGTALRDTECSACSDGTFSDGTLFTSCQPHTQCETLNLQLIKPGNASTDAECGEPGAGFSLGAVIGLVLVICLVIVLTLFCFLKKKKDTGRKTIKDNSQQCFRNNKHPTEEEQLQGVAVVNKHRDSQPDTAEERSRFNEIQLDAGTLFIEQK